ncbi:MAG TPA: hypothetical protein VLT59_04025, partial [Steroidobacteraceae bacterium]|nr:hypothetical protein [Steroidobacteraceae bacterium]
ALRSSGPWTEVRQARIQQTLGSLFERFDLDDERLHEALENLGALDAFITLGIEDTLCIEDPHGGNLVEEYLRRRGFQETPRARRYLKALRTSVMRLYEILAVEPGEWVELRDSAQDGALQRVSAPVWSHEMMARHYVAGRVLTIDDELVFSNAVLQFDEAQGEVLERIFAEARTASDEERERLAAESAIDAAVLARIANAEPHSVGTAVLQFWLNTLLAETLDHDDGTAFDDDDFDADEDLDDAPIEFYTASMEIDPADAAVIADRLDALPGWKRSSPLLDRWLRMVPPDEDPAVQELEESLWDISLEADHLYVEADSAEAIERIVAEIKTALRDLVGEPCIMCEEIEAPVGAEASLQAIQREIYRCLLDEPVPQFGNRTPREHAASEDGRRAVADWLRTIEKMEARQATASGLEPYDLGWVWQELGLEGERGRGRTKSRNISH